MSASVYSNLINSKPEEFQPFPTDDVNQSVAEAFEKVARKYSNKTAIHVNGRNITFRELDQLTDQLAFHIHQRLGDEEQPVAVLVEQGLSQIIAILSVLKAGNIYVVMDLSNPPERLAAMLGDLGARLVVTSSVYSSLAETVASGAVVMEMDKLKGGGRVAIRHPFDSPAGIYYTSGSTGQPKGVVYSQRNILHFAMTAFNLYCMNLNDRQPLPFSCSFAWSISPMFATLLCGGILYPINIREMNMETLAAWLDEKGITILQLSSSMFRQLLGVLDRKKRHFPQMKIILAAGEPLIAQDVRTWQTLSSPAMKLGCGLASTEASLTTIQAFGVDSPVPEGIVSLGYPTQDKEVLIVDEERRPLPAGETGEIVIRSEYLVKGYWRKPELTNAVFQKDAMDPSKRIYYSNDLGRFLPDGKLEHLGRKDHLVKIRSYSVDLLEVEQAIYDSHDVTQTVVIANAARHDPAQKQLVAYLVAGPAVTRDPAELRDKLARKLPPYMIPSFFVFLDSMPLNINGKVDRKALPPVDHTRELQERDLPLDDIEKRLVAIWQEVLNVKQVGVHEDFFGLGGDSLLATHLLLTIEKAFARRMPLAIISKASNISQQAEFLRNGIAEDFGSVLIPIQTNGNKSPLFCIGGKGGNPIRFQRLPEYLSTDQPVYFFRSRGFEAGERIQTTIEEIAADYLREVKKIQPAGPYHFLGESSGGLVAYEMAQRLHTEGQTTALLGMLDTYLEEMKSESGPSSINLFTLLKKHVQTLTSGGLRGVGNYIKYYFELWKFRSGEARDEMKRKKTRARQGELPEAYRLVDEANLLASRAYKPGPYPGRVVMFSATRQLALEGNNPDHGWSDVGVQDLVICPLDCYHGNILFEPFVQQVVGTVNQYLDGNAA